MLPLTIRLVRLLVKLIAVVVLVATMHGAFDAPLQAQQRSLTPNRSAPQRNADRAEKPVDIERLRATCLNSEPPDAIIVACEVLIKAAGEIAAIKSAAYLRRGNAYARTGQSDLALADLSEAIKLDDPNGNAVLARGNLYQAEGNIDRAIEDYSLYLKKRPNTASVLLNRADAYHKKGQTALAIADYTSIIKLNPNDGSGFLRRGIAYRESDHPHEAMSDFTKAAQLNPKSAPPLIERGMLYSWQNKAERAIQDFNQALALEPTSVIAFRERAKAYAAIGEHHRAAVDFDEVARLLPDDVRPRNDSCRQLILANKIERAIDTCTQIIVDKPGELAALELRAIAYMRFGRLDDAIADYEKVLSEDPKHAGSLYGRALAKKRKRELEEDPDIRLAKSLVTNIATEYSQFGVK
jgi:tetratricopeptide (TPR) repeat protein